MSIYKDREFSLTKGRFPKYKQEVAMGLGIVYIQYYSYSSTFGKQLRENPLQSLQRWVRSPMSTIRKWYIKYPQQIRSRGRI
jgi:hypothetical protein